MAVNPVIHLKSLFFASKVQCKVLKFWVAVCLWDICSSYQGNFNTLRICAGEFICCTESWNRI